MPYTEEAVCPRTHTYSHTHTYCRTLRLDQWHLCGTAGYSVLPQWSPTFFSSRKQETEHHFLLFPQGNCSRVWRALFHVFLTLCIGCILSAFISSQVYLLSDVLWIKTPIEPNSSLLVSRIFSKTLPKRDQKEREEANSPKVRRIMPRKGVGGRWLVSVVFRSRILTLSILCRDA